MISHATRAKVNQQIYRAVQAISPGRLAPVDLPVSDPGPRYVRIRDKACGICHRDAGTAEEGCPIEWPRVPGREAIGKNDPPGVGVKGLTHRQHWLRKALKSIRVRAARTHFPGIKVHTATLKSRRRQMGEPLRSFKSTSDVEPSIRHRSSLGRPVSDEIS